MMVAFAPQTLGLKPENFTRPVSMRLTLCLPYFTEKSQSLSLPGRLGGQTFGTPPRSVEHLVGCAGPRMLY